jgi:hypothetical protein
MRRNLDEIRQGHPSPEPLERINLRLPESVKEALSDLAFDEGRTMSSMIRSAIIKVYRSKLK